MLRGPHHPRHALPQPHAAPAPLTQCPVAWAGKITRPDQGFNGAVPYLIPRCETREGFCRSYGVFTCGSGPIYRRYAMTSERAWLRDRSRYLYPELQPSREIGRAAGRRRSAAVRSSFRGHRGRIVPRPHPNPPPRAGEGMGGGRGSGTEQWRCRDQKEIEGARAELDRNPVGEQLPLAQQHAKTPEFESRVGGSRARPVCVVRVSIRQDFRLSPWSVDPVWEEDHRVG